MTLRLKHLLGLATGAAIAAGVALSASATSFQGAVTNTYSAQTVAINNTNVAIPSGFVTGGGPLRYQTSSGQYVGDSIVFSSLTTGATFTGTPVAVCTGCPAATTFSAATISGNTITVTVTGGAAPPAFAVPPFATVTLVASAAAPPAGTSLGPSATLNGLPNLATASQNTAGNGSNPTVVLGTASPTTGQFPASIPVGQVPNVIVAAASCGATAAICAAVPTNDTNPVPVLQLVSVDSFSLNTSPVTQMIDLSGVGAPAGTQFQTVSGGVASTTPVGFLGTFSLLNNSNILDARFGNVCCNNSNNVNGANSPLAATATITITGDFQTITNAYLRIGPTTAQGQQPVETRPSANGTCTTSTGGGDIISSPLPLATGAQTLTFTIPTGTTTLPSSSGASFVNTPVYAICVVTNGSNIIADTFTNSPGSTPAQIAAGGSPGAGGIGGVIGSGGVFGSAGLGTNWTVTVAGNNFPNLVLARNTHPGFDIAYGGTKIVFTNVFAAQTGYATFLRLVNTGVGTFPVYAVIQKDGVGPAPIPGSFAAMTPFAAFYVSADAVAAQGGTILQGRSSTANTTMILLTPSSTFMASKLIQQPSGDVVITGPGL